MKYFLIFLLICNLFGQISDYGFAQNVEDYPISFMKGSLIKQDNIKQLVNIQKLFYLLVKFPKLQRISRKLIQYPLGLLFEGIFYVTYIIGSAQSYNLKLWESFYLALRMRNLYKDWFHASKVKKKDYSLTLIY